MTIQIRTIQIPTIRIRTKISQTVIKIYNKQKISCRSI